MLTRATLKVSALWMVATLLSAAVDARAQTPAGAQASSSAQGGASVERSGASAAGGADAAAAANDNRAALASGSSVNAVLTKPVDSGRSKPGDPVSARTTEASRTDGGVEIPKGSTLMGHVVDAHARGAAQSESSLAVVFDRAVTKHHAEIPLRDVSLRAIGAAEAAASSDIGNESMSAGGAGMGAARGGGGLVTRTSGTLGATAGAGLGGVSGRMGSAAGATAGALAGGAGAVGGINGQGLFSANSAGVFGMPGVSLAGAADSTTGAVITSKDRSVHLDQGTRLLLAGGTSTEQRSTAPAAKSDSKRGDPDKR